MKYFYLLSLCLIFASCDNKKNQTLSNPQNPEKFAKTITSEELKEMLYEFAGDNFKGRNTGTEGEEMARSFLKEHYRDYNVSPAAGTLDYDQKVSLITIYEPDAALFVNGTQYTYLTDFVNRIHNSENFNLDVNEVLFVGYGIDDTKYSDFSGIDVKGKVILIKEGEPKNADGTFLISGTNEKSDWSNSREFITKRNAALENGAQAVLFYTNKYNVYRNNVQNKIGRFGLYRELEERFIVAQPQIIESFYPAITSNVKFEKIPVNIKVDYERSYEPVNASNVVALVKGAEFPDEYIVLSAHLDHIGETTSGEIYNGADDDGSGSMALLEIAEAFQKAKEAGEGPRRSIVFLHVTGEEYGLFGSRYYTDFSPLYPLENTVANLNIDMIGRVDNTHIDNPNFLYLIGSDKLSKELHEVSEQVNQKYGNITFDYRYNDENDPNRYYYRSDHYSFAKNNVPVIFYFNGTHADYHKVSDTPDKINYELLQDRTRVIFHTAWELANRDQRIQLD